MLITKKSRRKKKSYFDIFSKFYSYLSLMLLACVLLLLFSTGYLNQYKEAFLYRFYKSSVNYYIDIFAIGFHALKGAFYTFPELNIHISFKNVVKRLSPFWEDYFNNIKDNTGNHLIVPHSNSLRAIVKILDKLSDKDIVSVNIPTGVPLVYTFDNNFNVLNKEYLIDEAKLQEKQKIVENQGKAK